MKKWYDRHSEHHQFSSGDQVMALLPVEATPFQAKFAGLYTVLKQVSDQNYLIATPNRRKSSQLCHVNLLKSYYARDFCDVNDSVVQKSCVGPTLLALSVVADLEVPVAGLDGDVKTPDDPIICGKLKNSDCFRNLDDLLNHLDEPQRVELKSLITKFTGLFGDTPTRTSLVEHDIDVGDSPPIRQRFYCCAADKCKVLESEVKHVR